MGLIPLVKYGPVNDVLIWFAEGKLITLAALKLNYGVLCCTESRTCSNKKEVKEYVLRTRILMTGAAASWD